MNNEKDCPCQCDGKTTIAAAVTPPVESPGRRRLLAWGTVILGGVAASAAGVPILGFLLAPLANKANSWIAAGKISDFEVGKTHKVEFVNPLADANDGETAKTIMYVRRNEGDTFNIFAVNCTHLGCPVSWFANAGLFMCPCHGGVYYEDGSVAAGPPPRELFQYPHKIENETLMVEVGHLPTLQQPA
ncbi:ubiquinol-cytochrome c reductase iron-sulfur subunit [Planctomycetes bacterium TBK1r]|uniref:Cytochrome b6-f complex iron-sulfur subunit n=1 Tax=Stieleria magnilauensis TaxID=2527963 RepID=A0ABX5XVX1_9BACT|nr:Cytochrome b6-f complex iron-sulfur subunit [Planctomycetes bacterium TBK1r]